MPRVKRKAETFVSPVLQELEEMLSRLDLTLLARPGMTVAKIEADRARWSAKWQRRVDKTIAKWRSMSIADRKAWTDAYGAKAKLPKTADIPLLFAVVTLAERDAAKAAKKTRKRPPVDTYAIHRSTGSGDRVPSHRLPPPDLEAAPATDAPSGRTKPRKKRRGPAVGVVGYQIDGVMHWNDEGEDRD